MQQVKEPDGFEIVGGPAGAVFNEDRSERYILWRDWFDPAVHEARRWLAVYGLNPSKADEVRSDPTVSQMVGRAKRGGFTGLLMLNSDPVVSTDPKLLLTRKGQFITNLAWVVDAARVADTILCAWGNWADNGPRIERVLRSMFEDKLYVLGLTKSGRPRHPRGVSLATPMKRWSV